MKALIIGAGIGGLSSALLLSRSGVTCEIHEQSPALKELGVGITVQPHAIKPLVDLGLLPALDAAGIRSEALHFATRRGATVWREPRGLAAGHPVPQFFIHRGHLQRLLADAVREQLGRDSIRLGRRLVGFGEGPNRVEARFVDSSGKPVPPATGDLLIGCDGIHSQVRRQLAPAEGAPRWSGLMMWRGATDWPAFDGGATVMICGGTNAKFVSYPIAPGTTTNRRLTNWVVIVRMAPDGSPLPRPEDWQSLARRDELAQHLGLFHNPYFDVRELVAETRDIFDYPMCDRDPIGRWSDGRVTLLGDAAHPMYPMGANGASQAILDAVDLASRLAAGAQVEPALAAYEEERLPRTAAIVLANRTGGPEGVIDAVETLAPDGFTDIEQVLSRAERQKILADYAAKVEAARIGILASRGERSAG